MSTTRVPQDRNARHDERNTAQQPEAQAGSDDGHDGVAHLGETIGRLHADGPDGFQDAGDQKDQPGGGGGEGDVHFFLRVDVGRTLRFTFTRRLKPQVCDARHDSGDRRSELCCMGLKTHRFPVVEILDIPVGRVNSTGTGNGNSGQQAAGGVD